MAATTAAKTECKSSYQETARQLLGEKALVFAFNDLFAGLEAYRRCAEMAVEFGATHMSLGALPFEYSWALPDNTDPYPNWSVRGVSLFRVFTPPAMQEFIPQEWSDRCKEHLAARAAVLRNLGLRASLEGGEPQWLPEAVYRAHPDWRGAQVELGRIAGKPYFAPSIDDLEVLEMYRWSMEQLCRLIPEVELASFWTNDCGSGLPWSVHSYPGMNGPMKYRMRNPGERIAGWMRALQQGARDAGKEMAIQLHSFTFTPADTGAIRPLLGKDLYLNGVNGEGDAMHQSGASLAMTLSHSFYPVLGLGDPVGFVGGLQAIYQPGTGRAQISVDDAAMPLARMLLETYLDDPGQGAVAQALVLTRAAARFAGEDNAEMLVRAWEGLQDADLVVRQVRQRGASAAPSMLTTTARWLTRPLVPEPLALTAEEQAGYSPYLFSVGSDEDNANLCYLLGKPILNGDSVVWMARWCLQDAVSRLQGLRGQVLTSVERVTGETQDRLRLYAARIGAAACVLENTKWTLMYQHALNIADQPRYGANILDFDDNCQWDQRALELRKIARAVLDNTAELLALLESTPTPLIAASATPEQESVFWYGPNLAADLRRKMEIMLNHWHDYERLYPTHKPWEFDALPGGE